MSEKVTNPRVSELTTIAAAAKRLEWSWWKVRRAMDSGKLESARLPTGNRAVLITSLESLISEQCSRGDEE